METYKLERVYLPTETLGSLYSPDGKLVCKTMELPYRNNAISSDPLKASCIPEGNYVFRKNPPKESRNYGYFRCDYVPGRTVNVDGKSSILIHRITYVSGLLGCIGVGSAFIDLNKDSVPDMIESSKTLEYMYTTFPEVFNLQITKKS